MTTNEITKIETIEWSHDSNDRQYRRLPRAERTLPVGTLVTADGVNVYRVIAGPAMDQDLVLTH